MDKKITIEEYIEKNGRLEYTNVGTSMLPLLRQGKDLFIVSKRGSGRCRKGDVVLYRRPPSEYVLHRIVRVNKADYVILGDNCVNREYGIKDKDIIAVMTGFVRNGKEHSVNDLSYRIYSFVWLHTSWLRIGYKKLRMRVSGLFKKTKPD